MSRFEIKTPVPNYTGRVAGISFADGRAVVTSDTASGLSALSYFKSQGYGIAPLDREGVDEVLTRANEDPASEHARIVREIQDKENRLELDKLRKRNAELDEEIFKSSPEPEQASDVEGEGAVTQVPLMPPPADSAGVAEWRKWAVESGRAAAEDVGSMSKTSIQAEHGAAYDRERAAQLQAGTAEPEVSA